MAAFARTQEDSVWVTGYVVPGADFTSLDVKTVKVLNGAAGGTWAPSSAITIGGEGLIFSGSSSVLTLASGANLSLALITFDRGDALDYFAYKAAHTARARVITGDCTNIIPVLGDWRASSAYLAAQSRSPGSRGLVPIPVHHGATLTDVTMHLRIVEVHANPPDELPRLRVIRVDADGTVEPLQAAGAGRDVNGFIVFPRPATGVLYRASGAEQTLAYTCNQNNVIDTELYAYFAEVIDEDAAGVWVTTGTNIVHMVTTLGTILYASPQ